MTRLQRYPGGYVHLAVSGGVGTIKICREGRKQPAVFTMPEARAISLFEQTAKRLRESRLNSSETFPAPVAGTFSTPEPSL